MQPDLIDRDAFRRMADVTIGASRAERTSVALRDFAGGTTRFANSEVVQNVDVRRQSLLVTVSFGQQRGSAGTSDLSERGIRDAVQRAERIARVAPPDPERLPPVGPQAYPQLATFRPETAGAGPDRRLAGARAAIAMCRAEHLQAAGIVTTESSVVGLAADTGLFAYEPRTHAQFSLTAADADSTGWVNAADRSIDQLAVKARTRVAIDKARRSAKPKELPAGRYTVILEPAAVAGLLGRVFRLADAKSYYKGTSPFAGRLGQPVIDRRLTLANRPEDPTLLGVGFDDDGLPSRTANWIEAGVLKQLRCDRFTARQHDVAPASGPSAPYLAGEGPAGDRVEDLIKSTDRGILVTTFWYIRFVNQSDLTLTGMTRDGTFLVENGEVVAGLINFRFHDSPLRAFSRLDAFTIPMEAVGGESGKMLVPAMRIRDFNFSSVTRF